MLTWEAAVLAIFIAVSILAAAWAKVLRRAWRPSRTRSLVVNLSLTFFSVAYSLLGAEIAFRFLVAESDSFAFTRSAALWFDKYWKPINSLGYRDVEPAPAPTGVRIVFVVGDSIVAGQGIEDPADRFSDYLRRELAPGYAVYNVSQRGWSIADERHAIDSHPLVPDLVILSWYVNDIEWTTMARGQQRPMLVTPPPDSIDWIVDGSYLVNFIYWRAYRFRNRHLTELYWDWLRNSFQDPETWHLHRFQVEGLIRSLRLAGKGVIVVVFPFLADVEKSSPFTARMVGVLKEQSVPFLDLTDRFRDRDPLDLVVSRMDAHPNEKVHLEVGGLLKEMVLGWEEGRALEAPPPGHYSRRPERR